MNKISIPPLKKASSNIEHYHLLGEAFGQRVFSHKDAGVNDKIFTFWKAKGLIDFLEKGKMSRLNITELVWVMLLETLRKFGCSVSLMKKLYDHYFTDSLSEHLATKNFTERLNYLSGEKFRRPLNNEEEQLIQFLQQTLNDKLLLHTLDVETSRFSELISMCLAGNTKVNLLLFTDGDFRHYVLDDTNFEVNPIYQTDCLLPHIHVSLNYFLEQLVTEESKQHLLLASGLLNEDEFRVVKEMRNDNAKSITITFKDNKHELEKIEFEMKGLISGDKAKKIMQILGMKNYEGVELHTRDGKTLSFKHTTKTFFKSSV